MRETLGYDKNNKDREQNDYYATPPNEVKNIMEREKLYGTILDNSCGEGHIIKEVKKEYPDNKVLATDLIDRGFGESNLDFLDNNYPYTDVDTIIMNPPFKLIEEFVNKSLEIAKKKVILFARVQFMESQSRYKSIFKENNPYKIYLYVDRVACAKNGNFNKKLSSNMAFAWYVWDKTKIRLIDDPSRLYWIRRYDKK